MQWRSTRGVVIGALAVLVALGPLVTMPATPSLAAAVVTVEPPGTTVLVPDAAWSWFEEERATFTDDGSELLTSAVAGHGSSVAAPGTVLLAEVRLTDGARRLVDLGAGEVDDHDSASIWQAETGEVVTSWSRHHQDSAIRQQRRRTDRSWLRLPPLTQVAKTTYSNLMDSVDADGASVLYDFFRGLRFDPQALASVDVGRTWTDLGRVLSDPDDSIAVRPYVQYANDGQGRIHLIATEAHPRNDTTSVYHGYIEAGMLRDSDGTALGPVGSAVPVTSLTRIWAPEGQSRAWSTDIVVDPQTRRPVVTFSVRHTPDDHRYWYARWDGSEWQAEEVAPAGGALYAQEADYTGLATIDPTDPRHLVVSTDVSPDDGQPLVSSADGERHWELWSGRRQGDGSWAWDALTSDSVADNLRPVLTAHASGASALLWLRGTYMAYTSYDLDVVGVVRRSTGSPVPLGPASLADVTDVLPLPPPRTARAQPVAGAFDGHPAADLLFVRTGTAPEDLLLGDEQGHPTPVASPVAQGAYVPVPGDFDGNGRTDVLLYAAGSTTDRLWKTQGTGKVSLATVRQVNGTYVPVPGDFNGDRRTDIYWYARGKATDNLWTATPSGTFTTSIPRQVNGTYVPVPGDFNRDGRTDIYWYAPGKATDNLWTATPSGTFTTSIPRQVNGAYVPVAGDFSGDRRTDVFWYAPGTATDSLWTATSTGTFTASTPRQVTGSYTPIAGDLDGDQRSDIHWYVPGAAADYVWWSDTAPLALSEVAAANL